jgi:hypothetical protein
MLENVYLAGKYFPTWKVYVYYAPDVTESMINHLAACSNVVLRATGILGAKNMIHRFFAIDEPDVDLMMVRDADSRIHWKDRWAIREFVRQPQFVAHTIRDNIEHTADMMGGLWGIRKTSGLNLHSEYAAYQEDKQRGHRQGHDQNFLSDVIYPKVVRRMLVHYSNGRRKLGEIAVEFPFHWINDIYCGRIECDFYDPPQPPIKSRPFLFPEVRVRVHDAPVVSNTPPPASPVLRQSHIPSIVKFLHRK